MYQAFVPITASSDLAELQIAHVGVVGDETLCIDNVRIVPGTRTPPAITKELVAQTVQAGAKVTFSVTASGTGLSYRWLQDGVPLSDGGAVSGATTATLTLNDVQVRANGTYTVLVTDGLGVAGSAAPLVVEATVVDVSMGIRLAGGKVVVSWPVNAAGFRLQGSSALPGTWTDEAAPAVEVSGNWEVQVDPNAAQRFYRLAK
jgi:hypothetical protein